MYIGREMLFHANGGTSAPDVTGQWKEFLHGDEVAFLVAGDFGGHFEVYFMFTGNDADKVAGFITVENQGFEYLVYVLAQAGSYVDGAKVVLIDFVRDEFVGDFGLIK